MAERKVYVFKHEDDNIDVYSPEAGNWVPFRDGKFETEDRQLAEWIALLRNPRITLPKEIAPVGTAINPLMDHAPAEGNERRVPETLPADAGSGTLDADPGDNPAVDMDDPQRRASRANAPTGSILDEGPERVRAGGAEVQTDRAAAVAAQDAAEAKDPHADPREERAAARVAPKATARGAERKPSDKQ